MMLMMLAQCARGCEGGRGGVGGVAVRARALATVSQLSFYAVCVTRPGRPLNYLIFGSYPEDVILLL